VISLVTVLLKYLHKNTSIGNQKENEFIAVKKKKNSSLQLGPTFEKKQEKKKKK